VRSVKWGSTMSKRIEVELWEVAKLIPYEKNFKKHSQEQVENIAGLIQRFGFTQPILIDPQGVVIAGHGRRLAAMHLKLERVPVRVFYDYTTEEIDGYRMADNQVVSTEYDTAMRNEELTRLAELDFDITTLGFDSKELDFLAPGVSDSMIDAVEKVLETSEEVVVKELDSTAVPVAKAFGFKRVTVDQANKIRSFIARLEASHGKIAIDAFLAHIKEVEEFS
jgi:hypothetical protein